MISKRPIRLLPVLLGLSLVVLASDSGAGVAQEPGAGEVSRDGNAPSGDAALDARLRALESELETQREENEELRTRLDGIEQRQLSQEDVEKGETESRGFRFVERAARSAYLGGYMDLEYRDSQDKDRTFNQHRFVPFIYVDATDQLKFQAEIEFEYGGSDSPAGDGETKIEFAHMDYVFNDAFSFRAGAILAPVGKFNLVHDSPVNDLTDRPLVDRVIIPTTLTEAGLGFFGTLPPVGEWDISYEAYLVNGFRGLDRDGTPRFSKTNGLRGARSSLKVDSNNSVAGVGRISVSPALGTELGVSAHIGKYDEAGDLWLALWAIDFVFKPGRFVEALTPLEIVGEFASAEIERNTLAREATDPERPDRGIPNNAWGAYGQLNYHFMPGFLLESLPSVFGVESTFTAITRLDYIEIDRLTTQRITFGMNFRPTEETAFKFDYQLNFDDWDRDEVRDDTFLFSVATFF